MCASRIVSPNIRVEEGISIVVCDHCSTKRATLPPLKPAEKLRVCDAAFNAPRPELLIYGDADTLVPPDAVLERLLDEACDAPDPNSPVRPPSHIFAERGIFNAEADPQTAGGWSTAT